MEQRNRGYTARHDAPEWVLLAYRLPREPSTPRITVWRKLRQLGAAQVVDGLVALPADKRTHEQFMWLAEEIKQSDGEAWMWEAELLGRDQRELLVATMSAAVTSEYENLVQQARAARREPAVTHRRTLLRLRRELRKIEARDYFASAAKRPATRAVEDLAANVSETRT